MPGIDYVHLPDEGKLLEIQPLDYPNPYDYKQLHRHDYFEIIFIESGAGEQFIDFNKLPMTAGDIFIVYPGQVHLMKRQTAQGLVLQFRKNIFEHLHPLKHHNFYNQSPELHCDTATFQHLYDLSGRIQQILLQPASSALSLQKACSYLQVILISLLELQQARTGDNKTSFVLAQFISLITENIRQKRKVSEYAELMNCPPDKLNELCKKGLGKTALEIIHEELMLEIRRLLLLDELSLKEIAYELNFDTPGNFNAFVKTKTGMTPGRLQESVLEIYN
jgi:AraC family transcriptional activator of pobA